MRAFEWPVLMQKNEIVESPRRNSEGEWQLKCPLELFHLFTYYKVKRSLSRVPFPGQKPNLPCPCFPGFNFQSTWSHEYCSPRVEMWFTVAWLYIKPTHRVDRQVTQSIAITLQGHPCKQPTVWSVWAWLPINELWPFSPILPVGPKPNTVLGVDCHPRTTASHLLSKMS